MMKSRSDHPELQDLDRPLSAEEVARFDHTFSAFRVKYGRVLAANGWTRFDVFGFQGKPATPVDAAGVAGILERGGELYKIMKDRLIFMMPDGSFVAKFRGSVMLSGDLAHSSFFLRQ